MAAIELHSTTECDNWIEDIRADARHSLKAFNFSSDDPLEAMFKMKFKPIGRHPTEKHALNLVEQINQTWTFLCSFAACKMLFDLHPEVSGYRIAPGASATQPLDVMSIEDNAVGAETFAAVDPKNNKKLEKDIKKMAERFERSKYVFFLSPKLPDTRRLQVDRGVEIWSLSLDLLGMTAP